MKVILLNTSPRKNWNTAQLLKAARKGAEEAGAETDAFRILNGKVQTLCSFDTLQVQDYSKFNMASFDAEHKKAHHEKQFPVDLEKARRMGMELVQLARGGNIM